MHPRECNYNSHKMLHIEAKTPSTTILLHILELFVHHSVQNDSISHLYRSDLITFHLLPHLSPSLQKFFRRKSARDLLPAKPVEISVEPWWVAQAGFITEDDIRVR